MLSAQEKIKTAVQEYKRLFASEYQDFLNSNQIRIGNQKNKWASTESDSALERHLYDLPEKLHHAIYKLLSVEELDWFTSRGDYAKKMAGTRWFMETYPEFKVTKDF